MKSLALLGPVLLFSIAIACSSSGTGSAARPATIDAFVKSYVAAHNAKDVAATRALWHSKSVACITPESADFFDRDFRVNIRHTIPLDYTFTAKPVDPKDDLPFKGYAVFPVRPAQQVQINYNYGVESSGIIMFWLVQEGNGWAEDSPCMTPETLQQFKASLPEIKANGEKTKSQVDSLQEPLRSELVALLKQGKPSAAADRYVAATGQDRNTAMFVIEEMQYRLESASAPK
jgi:hypothetical protein